MSFSNFKNRRFKKSLGQGMTEYIIIVGVIAVAAIGTFGYFGDTIENQVAGMAQELGGGDGTAARTRSLTVSAKGASDTAANHNDLSNYTDNGQAN